MKNKKNKIKRIIPAIAIASTFAIAGCCQMNQSSIVYALEDNVVQLANESVGSPTVASGTIQNNKLVIVFENDALNYELVNVTVNDKTYTLSQNMIRVDGKLGFYVEGFDITQGNGTYKMTSFSFKNENGDQYKAYRTMYVYLNNGTTDKKASTTDYKMGSTGTINGQNMNNVLAFNIKNSSGEKVKTVKSLTVSFDTYHVVSTTDYEKINIPTLTANNVKYSKISENVVRTDNYTNLATFNITNEGGYYVLGETPETQSQIFGRTDVKTGEWYDYTSADFASTTDFSTGQTTYRDATGQSHQTMAFMKTSKSYSTEVSNMKQNALDTAYSSDGGYFGVMSKYDYVFIMNNTRSGIASWNTISYIYEDDNSVYTGTFNENGLHAVKIDGGYKVLDYNGNDVTAQYSYNEETGEIKNIKTGESMNIGQKVELEIPSVKPGDEIEEGTHEGEGYENVKGFENFFGIDKVKDLISKLKNGTLEGGVGTFIKSITGTLLKLAATILGVLVGFFVFKNLIQFILKKIFKD